LNFHVHLRLVGVHFLTVAVFAAAQPLHRHRRADPAQEWEIKPHRKGVIAATAPTVSILAARSSVTAIAELHVYFAR